MGFWYLAHIAGFTLWVGGGAAAIRTSTGP